MTPEAAAELVSGRDAVAWHGMESDDVCAQLEVDSAPGLDADDVERRRAQYGPNKLAEAEKAPRS